MSNLKETYAKEMKSLIPNVKAVSKVKMSKVRMPSTRFRRIKDLVKL